MKRALFPLLIICIFFTASCKKTSTDSGNNCNIVSDFTVTQQADEFKFDIPTNGTSILYEVSIVWPQSSPVTGDNGDIHIISSSTASLPFNEISSDLAGKTFYVFVRASCGANQKTAWIGPKTITVASYCGRPRNLEFGLKLQWDANEDNNSTTYQVQYGLKDFALGTGTTVTTNNKYYEDASLQANNYYDFYVRALCGGGSIWSQWAGPYTYYSTYDLNLCNPPSNVQWTIERNGAGEPVGANFTWNHNGESYFEYVFVSPTQTVNDGTINSVGPGFTPTILVPQNTSYHFYVRGVCANGNRTSWTGPITFNIGS